MGITLPRENMKTTIPLITLLLIGCGNNENIPTQKEYVQVNGIITQEDGKPLKSATIYFTPTNAQGQQDELAAVKNGEFTTNLPTAEYKIAIDTPVKSTIPTRYTRYDTSKITINVKPGMERITIPLHSR